jgi:hypothetical protein
MTTLHNNSLINCKQLTYATRWDSVGEAEDTLLLSFPRVELTPLSCQQHTTTAINKKCIIVIQYLKCCCQVNLHSSKPLDSSLVYEMSHGFEYNQYINVTLTLDILFGMQIQKYIFTLTDHTVLTSTSFVIRNLPTGFSSKSPYEAMTQNHQK